VPRRFSLFHAQVGEQLVCLGGTEGQGTERAGSGRPCPPSMQVRWARSASFGAAQKDRKGPAAEAAVRVVDDGRHRSSVRGSG
jgi:hypothetical protein